MSPVCFQLFKHREITTMPHGYQSYAETSGFPFHNLVERGEKRVKCSSPSKLNKHLKLFRRIVSLDITEIHRLTTRLSSYKRVDHSCTFCYLTALVDQPVSTLLIHSRHVHCMSPVVKLKINIFTIF